MTYLGNGLWNIETERTDEERFIFNEGDVWPEKPPCPICEVNIDRSYNKSAVVREVEHETIFVTDEEKVSLQPDEFSVREYRMRIGVVEPCEHKFQNPSVLHDYVMGHKFGMGSIRGRSTAANELVENRLW